MRIAVVAPSCPLKPEAAEAVTALAGAGRGEPRHPPAMLSRGRPFRRAGSRSAGRACARCWPIQTIDAVWFARGGYGSNRIAAALVEDLPEGARGKRYSAIATAGSCWRRCTRPGWRWRTGRWRRTSLREGGEERSCAPSLAGEERFRRAGARSRRRRALAFNLMVLSSLMGTVARARLDGAELLIEEVDEELYRIDRFMFHVSSQPRLRQAAPAAPRAAARSRPTTGRSGPSWRRSSRHWCERAGVPYGGRADIGHDGANRVVPFPLRNRPAALSYSSCRGARFALYLLPKPTGGPYGKRSERDTT